MMLEDVENDQKTLYYGDQWPTLIQLNMDDAIQGYSSLALQKDSEFLQLFNHYIMKAYETGFFKRLFCKYYINVFIKDKSIRAEMLRHLKSAMFFFMKFWMNIN